MSEITATGIIETEYGERIVLDSPYEAKEFIKYAPWGPDQGPNYDELSDDTATPEFEFSDSFASRSSWMPDIGESGAWVVNVETFSEMKDFLESVGYDVDASAVALNV